MVLSTPILFVPESVNQILPSGPARIACGAPPTVNSVMTPLVVIRASLPFAASVDQRLPSGAGLMSISELATVTAYSVNGDMHWAAARPHPEPHKSWLVGQVQFPLLHIPAPPQDVPSETAVQAPVVPQVWHAGHELTLQQKPFTQEEPIWQVAAGPQAWPSGAEAWHV